MLPSSFLLFLRSLHLTFPNQISQQLRILAQLNPNIGKAFFKLQLRKQKRYQYALSLQSKMNKIECIFLEEIIMMMMMRAEKSDQLFYRVDNILGSNYRDLQDFILFLWFSIMRMCVWYVVVRKRFNIKATIIMNMKHLTSSIKNLSMRVPPICSVIISISSFHLSTSRIAFITLSKSIFTSANQYTNIQEHYGFYSYTSLCFLTHFRTLFLSFPS